ncbi:V-set and immunoglobulin domain-containing protein 1-like [Astyanax mexicanus]|nr:V-set and immunoglobulin domain-containing protein 1-like [Astyanax mexicanus]
MQPYTTLPLLAVLITVVNGGEIQVELRTEKSVSNDCHENATLHCIIISKGSDFMVFGLYWENKTGEQLCNYKTSEGVHSDPRIQCHYTPGKLSLTISNLSEADRGQYSCKLFTNFNHTKADTTLHVSDCPVEPVESLRTSFSVRTVPNHASPLHTKWTFLVLTAFILTL